MCRTHIQLCIWKQLYSVKLCTYVIIIIVHSEARNSTVETGRKNDLELFNQLYKSSTRTFLTFSPLFFLTTPTFPKEIYHSSCIQIFPRYITCCHPCTSSTWDNTWSKSCIQAYLLPALLSLHHRVEHSGSSCSLFWHVFLYAFVHEHTLPPKTVPTLSL